MRSHRTLIIKKQSKHKLVKSKWSIKTPTWRCQQASYIQKIYENPRLQGFEILLAEKKNRDTFF